MRISNRKITSKKEIYFLLFLIMIGINLHSQEKKILIGGDFGAMFYMNKSGSLNSENLPSNRDNLAAYYGSNITDHQSLILQTSPNVSIYLNDRLLIGAGIDFLMDSKKFDKDLIQENLVISTLFYPLIRYYFVNGFYGQARVNYGKSRHEITSKIQPIPRTTGYPSIDHSRKASSTTYGFGISPGYSISLGEHIYADVGANYLMHFNKAKYNRANSSEISYRHLQNIFYLSVGFKYIITG